MDLASAQILLADVLPGHGLDERRTAQREGADTFDHRHEVREAGDVGRARRAGTDHRGHLRDDARHVDLLAEQVPRRGEHADAVFVLRPWVDARAARVDEPDHRPTPVERHLPEPGDLLLAGLADAAAFDREVVRRGADHPSVDFAEGADDGVRGGTIFAARASGEAHLGAVHPDFEERPVVEESFEPFTSRELSTFVLLRDLLGAALLLDRGSFRF